MRLYPMDGGVKAGLKKHPAKTKTRLNSTVVAIKLVLPLPIPRVLTVSSSPHCATVPDQVRQFTSDENDNFASGDDEQSSPTAHQPLPTSAPMAVTEPPKASKWAKKKKRTHRAMDLAGEPQVAAVDLRSYPSGVYISYFFQSPTDFERQTLMSIPVIGTIPNLPLPMPQAFDLETAEPSTTANIPEQTPSALANVF
ncbi:hypothetical protein CDV36_009172 [Fusarium kuroshium]|uniref:Uncharacterized protein n=1 Tax=Fusarium kuroshium TaxID=2010991 RepID=A0A3M2S1U2_9HYPO|nr:hypothetical protein CDV36_009172 [Fusarium kuroshium]